MTISQLVQRLVVPGLFAALLLSGCHSPEATTTSASSSQTATAAPTGGKIRIGYQKATPLDVLRLSGDLDHRLAPLGVTVEWTDFAAGPQTLEAMNGGSVDVSSMGDTPPIFAEAAGVPFVYIANESPGDGSARAILVAKNSSIRSVSDLRGKRIAVQKGSGTHNFLIQALAKAGVPYDSVHLEYLAPADGRVAFEAGSVDAWAIWDPFLAAAEQTGTSRVLVDGNQIITSGEFYLSSRSFALAHPDWIKVTLDEVDKKAKWIDANPRKAAELLAPALAVDVNKLELVERRAHHGAKYIGFRTITPDIVATQQKVADIFLNVKLLPKKVDIKDALLTPEQYAALAPANLTPAVALAKTPDHPTK